jgi:hypothetical protein
MPKPLAGIDLRPVHPRHEASQSLASCAKRMRPALEISPQGDIPGRAQVTRDSHFYSNTRTKNSGAKRARTADLLHAMQALYQLSYSPSIARVTRTRTAVSIPVHRTLPNILDTGQRPGPKVNQRQPQPRYGSPSYGSPSYGSPAPSGPGSHRALSQPSPAPRPSKAQRSAVVAEHRLRQRPGVVLD